MNTFQVFLSVTRGPPCEEMQLYDPEIFGFSFHRPGIYLLWYRFLCLNVSF